MIKILRKSSLYLLVTAAVSSGSTALANVNNFINNGALTVSFNRALLGGVECNPADETIQCFDANDVGADSVT